MPSFKPKNAKKIIVCEKQIQLLMENIKSYWRSSPSNTMKLFRICVCKGRP